jgi:hypothetical protein
MPWNIFAHAAAALRELKTNSPAWFNPNFLRPFAGQSDLKVTPAGFELFLHIFVVFENHREFAFGIGIKLLGRIQTLCKAAK